MHLSSDRFVMAHNKPKVASVNFHVNEFEMGHTRTESYGNDKYCLKFFEKVLNYAYISRLSYLCLVFFNITFYFSGPHVMFFISPFSN